MTPSNHECPTCQAPVGYPCTGDGSNGGHRFHDARREAAIPQDSAPETASLGSRARARQAVEIRTQGGATIGLSLLKGDAGLLSVHGGDTRTDYRAAVLHGSDMDRLGEALLGSAGGEGGQEAPLPSNVPAAMLRLVRAARDLLGVAGNFAESRELGKALDPFDFVDDAGELEEACTDAHPGVPERPQCASCDHWEGGVQGDPEQGLCRRLPPVWVAQPFAAETQWPETRGIDYCGEHSELSLVISGEPLTANVAGEDLRTWEPIKVASDPYMDAVRSAAEGLGASPAGFGLWNVPCYPELTNGQLLDAWAAQKARGRA